ncbi:MAG: glycosyltransferase family A protein [Dongiaceae bacterium]
MSRAEVSVVVAVRNGAARLGEALDSIRAQSHAAAEIVVVDGRSTDDTVAVATQRGDVRLLRQEGEGLGDARNRGIAAARCPVIAFLDHDDLWTPGKLARQLAALAALPPPAGIVAHLVERDPDGIDGPPRPGRTPGTLLADRALLDAVGGFATDLAIGTDMEWFARAAERGARLVLLPDVLLVKRRRDDSLSADRARSRAEAFAVLRRSLARRRASGP